MGLGNLSRRPPVRPRLRAILLRDYCMGMDRLNGVETEGWQGTNHEGD